MNPDWDGIMKARAREPKPPVVILPTQPPPNVERAITDLCEIREAASALGDQGHDIACWAEDALKALGYDK